jgi:hypothetical protein
MSGIGAEIMTVATIEQQTLSRAQLEEQRDQLYERLDTGFARIDAAQARGRDVSEWEILWVSLLAQYESVCRQIESAS